MESFEPREGRVGGDFATRNFDRALVDLTALAGLGALSFEEETVEQFDPATEVRQDCVHACANTRARRVETQGFAVAPECSRGQFEWTGLEVGESLEQGRPCTRSIGTGKAAFQ